MSGTGSTGTEVDGSKKCYGRPLLTPDNRSGLERKQEKLRSQTK